MSSSHNNFFNIIALIVRPNLPCDKSGTVKLSHVKVTKVLNICDDIESLISNSEPSISQVLLSLNIFRKTGSSEIKTDLHRLVDRLRYTETKFVKDKWVEWSKKQSNLVPNTFTKGFLLHMLLIILTGKKKHLTILIGKSLIQ